MYRKFSDDSEFNINLYYYIMNEYYIKKWSDHSERENHSHLDPTKIMNEG